MTPDEDDAPIEYQAPDSFDRTDVRALDNGIRMEENDSYDVLIDGLKAASEGARNLAAHLERDRFDLLADTLDMARTKVVRLAGRPRPGDTEPSRPIGVSRISRIQSYNSIYDGLTTASRAARQFSTGHRGDLHWTLVARDLDKTREFCGEMVRRRTKTSPFLIT